MVTIMFCIFLLSCACNLFLGIRRAEKREKFYGQRDVVVGAFMFAFALAGLVTWWIF